jgi:hypothetical protein
MVLDRKKRDQLVEVDEVRSFPLFLPFPRTRRLTTALQPSQRYLELTKALSTTLEPSRGRPSNLIDLLQSSLVRIVYICLDLLHTLLPLLTLDTNYRIGRTPDASIPVRRSAPYPSF